MKYFITSNEKQMKSIILLSHRTKPFWKSKGQVSASIRAVILSHEFYSWISILSFLFLYELEQVTCLLST